VVALHGNLDQTQRETALTKFRKRECDILVATDVAARGLDIENVNLVVNYDLPDSVDTYIHRIGRTGRIGNKGEAISFVCLDDGKLMDSFDVLKEVKRILGETENEQPEFLDHLLAGNSAGGSSTWSNWKNPKDERKDGYGTWEERDWTKWKDWRNQGSGEQGNKEEDNSWKEDGDKNWEEGADKTWKNEERKSWQETEGANSYGSDTWH